MTEAEVRAKNRHGSDAHSGKAGKEDQCSHSGQYCVMATRGDGSRNVSQVDRLTASKGFFLCQHDQGRITESGKFLALRTVKDGLIPSLMIECSCLQAGLSWKH